MTVVVRRRDGLKGALLGRGLGPCTEAVILSDDVDGINVDLDKEEEGGISKYADPDAEGIIEVCRTVGLALVNVVLILTSFYGGIRLKEPLQRLNALNRKDSEISRGEKLCIRLILTDLAELIWYS